MASYERDYTVERERRREDTRRKRKERLMCAYIKHVHPTVYEESCKIYQHLNAMHPNTRDLQKTPYFINLKNGVGKKPSEKKASRKNCQGHKFTLEIPLMRMETQTTTTSPPSPVVAWSPSPVVASSPLPVVASSPSPVVASPPSPVAASSPSPVVALSPSPVVASLPSPVVASPPSPVAASSPSPVVALSPSPVAAPQPSPPLPVLPPVPSEVYQTLLEELQQDPALWEIFNNFPLQQCNEQEDRLVAEDIGDISGDISPLVAEDIGDISGDISPLEVELR